MSGSIQRGGGKDGTDTTYSGSNTIDEVAWYRDNSDAPGNSGFWSGKGTLPVGMKAPNELGAYDMSGNVVELCNDWYSAPIEYCRWRGGGWGSPEGDCIVPFWAYYAPALGSNAAGFRAVRTASP